jgi:putative Holliday junction resolvase
MAIDYGDARTGVAVSDESASLAGEAWVIREGSPEEAARAIATAAVSRGVSIIVVGYPKNMNGTVGPRAEKSEQFAELIRSQQISAAPPSGGFEVVLWDERMTTMSAHRILSDAGKHGKKRKEAVDAVAASVILQSYLDYLKNRG